MHLSDIPQRVAIPFGASAGAGYIRPIPVASQIGTTPGAASFTDGFPPTTFTPLSGGGYYVNGEDVNGILNFVTGWTRWQSAGGTVSFDAAFATAINGYPYGAVLRSSVNPSRFWVSTADNNLTDPDGGAPANWTTMGAPAADNAETAAGAITNKYVSPAGLASLRASVADARAAIAVDKFLTPASLGGLSRNVANPGSYELPGMLLQFGKFNFFSDNYVNITFPIPFAHAAMLIPVQYQRGGGDQDNNEIVNETLTNTGWSGLCTGAGSGSPMTMNWLAFGTL